MSILFRGQLRAVDFCAEHILGTRDFERGPPQPGERIYDAVVIDHPLVNRWPSGGAIRLHVPQWLRQRVCLGDSWQQTVAHIPTSLRKRISRLLRGSCYETRLESSPRANDEFYRSVYLPYVSHRFGSSAILASARSFTREAEAGLLLQLRLQGHLLGAALVRMHGDTLYLGKGALTLDHAHSHVFDLLDYFCLLLAQLSGCRYLDLGVSRPHIEDGVFANKAKWRPQLVPAGTWKSNIRIRPAAGSRSAAGFLARNGFIERRGAGFIVRRLYTEHSNAAFESGALEQLAARAGLDAVLLEQA